MWRPERSTARPSEAQARELALLDRILAGDPGAGRAGEDEGFAAVVLAIRDDRPALRPDFEQELERRVAAGFPRGGEAGVAGPGRGRRVPKRAWLAGLGSAATAAVVVAVVAGSGGGGGTSRSPIISATGSGPGGSGRLAAPARVPTGPAGGTQSVSPNPPPAAGAGATQSVGPNVPAPAAVGGSRSVQRDASVALLARPGRVQQVADRAIAVTDRLGGVVASSNVSVDDQGGSQATLAVQVPSAALDPALAAYSALAHVSSRSEDALDITASTGAARSRLAASQAERHALLGQLARATDPSQVASIHASLGLVAGRIAADQQQLDGLQTRGRYAQVSLTVTEDQQSAGAGGSGWGPGAALDEALSVLEAVFAVLIVGLAGLVPVVVLGALVWWALGPLRRRRREGVLAPAG